MDPVSLSKNQFQGPVLATPKQRFPKAPRYYYSCNLVGVSMHVFVGTAQQQLTFKGSFTILTAAF